MECTGELSLQHPSSPQACLRHGTTGGKHKRHVPRDKSISEQNRSDPSNPNNNHQHDVRFCYGRPTRPGLVHSVSKLAISKFTAYLHAEHPRITSISLDPGVIATDMGTSVWYLAPYMKDTPELAGGFAVWLASWDKAFLSGRVFSTNWDVDELEAKEDTVGEDLLTICYRGKFGGSKTLTLN